MRAGYVLVACVLALVGGCSPKAETRTNAPATATVLSDEATTKEVHDRLIRPGSDALFAAEADEPSTPERWREVEAAAQQVVDGAALLQTGTRPQGRADWSRIAKAVEEGAKRSKAAAEAKDIEGLALADGDFVAQCEDCHKLFRDAGGGMMGDPTR